MGLSEFIDQFIDFDALPPREKIRAFAWYLHTYRRIESFDFDAIRSCYKEVHISPDQVSIYMKRMTECKPPDLVKERSGYKLLRSVRSKLDTNYGFHHSVLQVSKLLTALPEKVPDLAEQTFLVEAIKCYRVEAYRACIVMTWNLAFDHLLRWILKDAKRLSDFNTALQKRYPKKMLIVIAAHDNFEELKESEIIEICNSGSIIPGSLVKILREKLVKRNSAAHPSSVVIVQSQTVSLIWLTMLCYH